MKSNLDKLFKNDEALEENGIWFDISDATGFLVRRFGGFNSPKIKVAMAKYYKPYARQVDAGTLDQKKEKEIMTRVFVESCIIGWRGIEIQGEEKPFDVDTAVELLSGLPELADTLIAYSSDSKNYREDLGNS